MSLPRFVFLDLTTGWRLPAARAGGLQAGHQLRCAYAIAALRAKRVPACAVELSRVTTLAALMRAVRSPDPDVVVLWAAEPSPPLLRAVARSLRAAQHHRPAAVLAAATTDASDVDAAVGDELESICTALAGASSDDLDAAIAIAAAPAAPVQLDDLVSPWLAGVLPAAAVSRVGVEIDRPSLPDGSARRHPAERIAAELSWIDSRAVPGSTAFLHGELLDRDPACATRLFETIAADPPRRIELGVTIAAEQPPDLALLRGFAAAGGRRLALVLTTHPSPDEAVDGLRAWRSAAAAVGARTDVLADLPAEPRDLDALESLLARVADFGPALRYRWTPPARDRPPRRPARLAVPELASSPSFGEEVALESAAFARLLRAEEGLYVRAPRGSDAVVDLVWMHPDPPLAHEGWLSQLLSTESLLVVGGGGAPAVPAPLTDVWVLRAERRARHRLDTGDAIDILPYREGRVRSPEVPLVLTLEEPDELLAMLSDADEAHRTGVLPPALASELTHLQDAVLWTAPLHDPAPRLARLWVDREGGVRPGPGAQTVGSIGDPLHVLRHQAARQAVPASRPPWLSAKQLIALHAERPWLLAFAAAPAARRSLAALIGPRPGRAVVQLPRRLLPVISGLGGHVCVDDALRDGPRASHLLLRAGEAHLLFDPLSGRLTRVSREVAAIWETLACTDDSSAAIAWLVERLNVDPTRAEAIVEKSAARLASSVRPVYAEAAAGERAEP